MIDCFCVPSWIVFSLPHLVLLVKTFFYFFFGVLGKAFCVFPLPVTT
nr:MAG TPA: hypothetical protein [Caudoviricetes sp.]